MPARLAPDDGAPPTVLSPPSPPGAASTRRVLVLLALGALLLLIGAASVILSLSREAAALHQAAAVEEAQRVVRSATGMRDFYSAEVVPRAREAGVPITHDYRAQPGTLPLPATMMLELGPWMDRAGDSTRMRLYSDRPFPWRAASRSFDGFERDALAALRADPDTPFMRIEENEGRRVLRYAVADRLKASCVECHNRYPGSPKTDWAVGDVRGVLEVASPIADGVALLEGGMRRALAMSVVVVACAIGLVAFAFRGLQASVRSSERLAADREAANLQLRGEVARRAETEAILRFSESTLRATFDGMQDGVLVYDRAMRIVQCNRVASAMFGYAAHQLPGTSVLGLLPGEALAETGPGRRRIEGMRRDGERFAADVAVSEIRMGDAPYFAALVSDATAQVRYERELAAARDAALDTARAKSQFLANMSHEIRTPMNGVIGVTGLLRDTALTAEQAGLVDTVQRSANALLTIIDDILDLSKIESGRFRLHRTDFDPVEIVEDTLELLAERAAVRGLRLGYAVDGPMPAAIHADEVRLRQVLNNLVGNAVKFTSEGEVTLRLAYLDAERRLEVRVRDTGPGIPAERIGDLFQPFSQIDGSATRRFGGTGLGLAISRQLVELMGGTISVTSREGEGSEFRFTIDWLPPAGPPAEATPARARLAGRALRVVGFDPVQRAQLASWGLVLHDESAGPPDAPLLVDGADTDAPAAAARAVAATGDGPPRAAVVGRRPIEGAASLPRLAWPLRARAVAALLDGTFETATDAAAPAGPDDVGADPGATDGPPAAPPRTREALVVEDNAVNQMLAVALLERMGISATVAADGAAALERLGERRWDIVLMDVQMPVMDGFEATRRWRDAELARGLPHTPVIALTANAMQGDRERCLEAGMDDYLSKPIDRAQLAERLARWLPSEP